MTLFLQTDERVRDVSCTQLYPSAFAVGLGAGSVSPVEFSGVGQWTHPHYLAAMMVGCMDRHRAIMHRVYPHARAGCAEVFSGAAFVCRCVQKVRPLRRKHLIGTRICAARFICAGWQAWMRVRMRAYSGGCSASGRRSSSLLGSWCLWHLAGRAFQRRDMGLRVSDSRCKRIQ